MKVSEKKRRRRERSRRGGRGEKRRAGNREKNKSGNKTDGEYLTTTSTQQPVGEEITRRRRQREALRKRVIARRRKGGKVRRVGTEKKSGARRKTRENRPGVERVTEYWVSGMITNQGGFSAQSKAGATGKKREGGHHGSMVMDWAKPSLVVLRNVEVQSIVRREALICGIPTVGRVTRGRSSEDERRRTYGRPWKHIGEKRDTATFEQHGREIRVSRRKKARREKPKRKKPRRKKSRSVRGNKYKHQRTYNRKGAKGLGKKRNEKAA
jgi:hypothetical protein